MRVPAVFIAVALSVSAAPSPAETFDAGPWTVAANARGGNGQVRVSGSVKGPRCALLRLDFFTHDSDGHRGHVIAQAENIGSMGRHFRATGHAYGKGRRTQVSSVYATCQKR